ncbi:predicted protein [Naegleria gruberi]|uniref:non-specific serine/threonine protein kinase n=1 Tax=Naegleria gruberi TaxID=5762 RepID=D2VYK1_NAEGR|nr:uncharacterized protein NAEGRDRAFT_74149 [Naegleria gruberi]EFC38128.1 predicted protein [Naegleria gruberi]|eukprot:XP_002670872.1 predicted protein [Naegleria gruberi strain NEG-M]
MVVFGGLGTAGFSDGYHAKETLFNTPSSLSVSPNGDLYIADTQNNKIRIVSASTGLVSSISATFNKPLGIVVSSNNILYIADTQNNLIKKYDISTRVLSTIGGEKAYLDGSYDNVDANSVIMKSPKNIHVVSNGKEDTVYFTDEERVKRIDSNGKYRVVDGLSPQSNLYGIFVTSSNEIWTTSPSSHFVQMKSVGSAVQSTFIGQQDLYGYEGDDLIDSYSKVLFYNPSSLVLKNSIVYLVDQTNNCIRKIDTRTKVVSTFSGGVINHPYGENIQQFETSPTSSLSYPFSFKNELFFIETSSIVRKVSNGLVKTVLGSYSKLQIENSPKRKYIGIVTNTYIFPNGDMVIVTSTDVFLFNIYTEQLSSLNIPTGITSISGIGNSLSNGTLLFSSPNFITIYRNGEQSQIYNIPPITSSCIVNQNGNYSVYFLVSYSKIMKINLAELSVYETVYSSDNSFQSFSCDNDKIYLMLQAKVYEMRLNDSQLIKIGGADSYNNSGNIFCTSVDTVERIQSGSIKVINGAIYNSAFASYITISNATTQTIVGINPSRKVGKITSAFARDEANNVIYYLDRFSLKKFNETSGEIISQTESVKGTSPTMGQIPFFFLVSESILTMAHSSFDNSLFIVDVCHIVQVFLDTMNVTKIAGNGCGAVTDGPALDTRFRNIAIKGLSVNPENGDIYLSDSTSFRKLEKRTGMIVTRFASNVTSSYSPDGPVTNFTNFGTILFSYSSNEDSIYYCTSTLLRVIEKMANGTYYLRTIIGNGKTGYSGNNLPALESSLSSPISFYVKKNGDIIILDGSYIIRKYTRTTGLLTTLAGSANENINVYSGNLSGKDTKFMGFSPSIGYNENTEEVYFIDSDLVLSQFITMTKTTIRKLSVSCVGNAIFNSQNQSCECLKGYYGSKCESLSCNGTLASDLSNKGKDIASINTSNIELSDFPTGSTIITSSAGSAASNSEDYFSRYTNIERIGQGAFGSVYKANDSKAGNRIKAVKVIKFESFSDLNTIMKEASQLSHIKHPNILKVNDYFITQDSLLCIDMDYYESGDLNQFLKRECSENIIKQILKQSCEGLNYIHSQLSIIHRDIKPSNIFVKYLKNDNIEIVIADFGLAKKHQEMKGQSYVGTPLFMSPEIALGSSYSFNTDIFSLGVSIYQIMTKDETTSISNLLMGNQSSNAQTILTKQMRNCSISYSNELIQLILQMLDKNRETRPTAQQLLKFDYFK